MRHIGRDDLFANGASGLSQRGVSVFAASLISVFVILMLRVVAEWLREKTQGKPRPATVAA